MPGILVGVDGSGHSQRALEWAMKEAGLRHEPLNVLTVHQAVAGYYGGVSVYTDDPAHTSRSARRLRRKPTRCWPPWPNRGRPRSRSRRFPRFPG